ncbi:hypothetical protein SAMN06269185_2722 [Natronoarchaeum philippinense]|uniref:Uncharacterized protein n=1 Tax=Natronoarchaeum philippinense TaxID=558529 RepID=A0A285P395_NATPI|nr:hypothetical protein [Natronoarchaeum philippinense]SNZ16200.1 hypothetical protein SAMN06269185_2722 [Natronoarchaeum philippinense]
MDRRRYLSALAATGASASLAGCSNPLSDGSTPERDPQNAVMDKLYTAIGELNTAALALGTVSADIETPADVEFDASGPRDRIETARTALDEAEDAASGSFETELQQARTYADVIAAMVDAFADLLTGARDLSTLESQFDPDAIGELRTMLEASRDPLSSAVTAAENATSGLESAEASVLRDLDAAISRVSDAASTLVGFSQGLDGLSLGYLQLVDGVADIDTAQQRFTEEAYSESQTAFENARTHFQNSQSTFQSGAEAAPEQLDERFSRATDRSDSLNTLAGGYATMLGGMTDLQTGRQQFENEEYEAASESFAAAGAAFEDASATFDTEPAPAGEFDSRFETARCRSGHLVEAADTLSEAATAADNGNLIRARSKAEEGQQQVEAAKNC